MATVRRVQFIGVLVLLFFIDLGSAAFEDINKNDAGRRFDMDRANDLPVRDVQREQVAIDGHGAPRDRVPFPGPVPVAGQARPQVQGGIGQKVVDQPAVEVQPRHLPADPVLPVAVRGAALNAGKKAAEVAAHAANIPERPHFASGNMKKPIKISEAMECAQDVKALCSESSLSNNFAIMDCLQYDNKNKHEISDICQNYLWNYKKNLTKDIRFDNAANEVCSSSLKKLPECDDLPRGQGLVIPCLVEHKRNVTDGACRQFLTKIASLVFSDYRLVYKFTDACGSEISSLKCGRLQTEAQGDDAHLQGATIECLGNHFSQLNDTCKLEILRIAELQSDDFHQDRPLFYACREDRERFCPKTRAGSGKVFKCLFRHKFERQMSSECQQKLVQRQKLMQENFKVNRALAEACRRNIQEYKCLLDQGPTDLKHVRMSRVLLCLEGQIREGNQVDPECIDEMGEMRRSLLEDYMISPNIVSDCSEEISTQCGGMHRGGKTLHCLMDLARPKVQREEFAVRNGPDLQMKQMIGRKCERALGDLLKEADVGENVMLDPTVVEACQTVIENSCKTPGADDNVMSCLMDKVGTNKMTDNCEERLIEIQYFISRDFKMEARLYKLCHKDAVNLCDAPTNWFDPNDDDDSDRDEDSDIQKPLVFSCLYSMYKKTNELSRACAFEVKRVMRQRATNVGLEPRIEEQCIQELGWFCSEKTQRGEEMECLQDHIEDLDEPCRYAVGNFTEDEAEDITLDKILMRSCMPMIERFCKHHLDNDNTEAGDIMDCLIHHKNNEAFDNKCYAGVQHHQLISLEDYRFSFKFKEACKEDVLKLCRGVRKKSDVIKCLSETVRNNTLRDEEHRVQQECRSQMRVELLRRGENIDLDDDMKDKCGDDVQEYCSNVSPGKSAVIECLRKHMHDLSGPCHKLIFRRMKQQFSDPSTDYLVMTQCKSMIKAHCMDENPRDILACLKSHKDDNNFDPRCLKLLVERQRTQMKDYRLNPKMLASCADDISKFCKNVVDKEKTDIEMEGNVINCLRIKFAQKKLSFSCHSHVSLIIKESAMDYKQDPILAARCKDEIMKNCLPELESDNQAPDDRGRVVECLKERLAAQAITSQICTSEIARVLAEDRADVHVDPLLHRACSLDIQHYCFDVPSGEGRQMSCLLAALEDSTVRLKPECHRMLTERVRMWEYAARAAPPETLAEMMSQITMSNQRNYFLGVIFAVIGSMFIVGLFCGRVTKRTRRDKNK